MTNVADIAEISGKFRTSPPATLGGKSVTAVDDFALGFENFAPSDLTRLTIDGGSRVIVRPSGTEPKLKCYLQVVVPVSGDIAEARATAQSELDAVRTSVSQVLAL